MFNLNILFKKKLTKEEIKEKLNNKNITKKEIIKLFKNNKNIINNDEEIKLLLIKKVKEKFNKEEIDKFLSIF